MTAAGISPAAMIFKDSAYFHCDARRITPPYNPFVLAFALRSLHCFSMRRTILLLVLAGAGWGDDPFGIWRLKPSRSTFAADRVPTSFTLRIERHAKGEVFTVERTEQDGRSSSDSSILYLDGKPRDYEDLDCKGTQSSQRVDNRTVEILRACEAGGWIRIIRQVTTDSELVLRVSGRRSDGRQVETRLVLEKQ